MFFFHLSAYANVRGEISLKKEKVADLAYMLKWIANSWIKPTS